MRNLLTTKRITLGWLSPRYESHLNIFRDPQRPTFRRFPWPYDFSRFSLEGIPLTIKMLGYPPPFWTTKQLSPPPERSPGATCWHHNWPWGRASALQVRSFATRVSSKMAGKDGEIPWQMQVYTIKNDGFHGSSWEHHWIVRLTGQTKESMEV